MKALKRIMAVMLSAMFVVLCFAGCSSSGTAEEITSETMLIAYTEDNAPFIYEENGEVKGFDVEVFETIFDNIKNEFKNYKFVKVDSDYVIGETVYTVDADGNDCIAYVMVGGVQKDVDDVNEAYSFTEDVINDRIIAVTKDGYGVTDYTKLNGKDVGVVSDAAITAFDKHTTIKNGCKSVNQYEDFATAAADLESGKINAIIVDEFTYYTADAGTDSYIVLDGELDNISYVYAVAKWDWYKDSLNEAIYELQSPDYNDADEFTPIVEKYFGYDASSFTYVPVED